MSETVLSGISGDIYITCKCGGKMKIDQTFMYPSFICEKCNNEWVITYNYGE